MKISFFKNGYIALGEDHSYIRPETVDGVTDPGSGHPDCIFCKDIEFDPNKQSIQFDPETQKIKIEDIPETPGDKKNKVYNKIISGESSDTEGHDFSDIEIGDIITARVFGGNPYAQMVLQAKATEAMFRKMAGQGTPEDDIVITRKNLVMQEVNRVRAIFSLSPM